MIDLSPQQTSEEKVNGSDSPVTGEMVELRDLLLAEEREKIAQLQKRLDDPKTYIEQLSRALPESIQMRSKRDKALSKALSPTIEESLNKSVKKNPRAIADAIFPIIGPAIRKAISSALRELVQAFNQALEHSISIQGLKWRLEAMRSGKTFAEVVMSHTLRYRVEQVFLIHRETGLLLQHVADPEAVTQDADMVSGMLTAIQDFIRDFMRDSFGSKEGESLQAFEVESRKIWLEQGPYAVLAAVIGGDPMQEYRSTLQDAIETLHLEFGDELSNFQGDVAPFERARPILEGCLYKELQGKDEKQGSPMLWLAAGVLGILIIGLGVWWFLAARREARFDNYVKELSAKPGLIVVDYGKRDGKFFVTGLRDMLAADPAMLMQATEIDPQSIVSRWEMYQSSDAEFVLLRAKKILQPPEAVNLDFRDGMIYADGVATEAWISDAERLSSMIPGVSGLQTGGLIRAALIETIEQSAIRFEVNLAVINPDQQEALRQLALALQNLNADLQDKEKKVEVLIAGHADQSGAPETNMRLQQERAENVMAALRQLGVVNLSAVEWKIMSPMENPTRENERKVTFAIVYAKQKGE